MPLPEQFAQGLKLYLLMLSFTLVIALLIGFVYSMVTRTLFFEAFRWTLLGAVFLMLIVGFASLLPFSEYHYGDPFNPAAKREQVRAVMKGRQTKAGSIAFALVGLTLLLIYFLLFPF